MWRKTRAARRWMICWCGLDWGIWGLNVPAALRQASTVKIARCLATNVVVLFDEPFAGVDPLAVSAVKETLRGLAGQGIGVLVTDHAVHETLTGCDRAIILDAGTVVASGTPEEVSDDPNVRARYLGANFEIRRPAPH